MVYVKETHRKSGPIEITYYVNPHEFWFKYADDDDDDADKQLEERIQRLANVNKNHYNHAPSIGDIVIVKCLFMDKYIRARVDYELKYSTGSQFVLWAIDYGFPIQSITKWITKLTSGDLKTDNPRVFKATLNRIVPATPEYDYQQSKSVMAKTGSWREKAIKEFERIYSNSTSLIFHYDCHAVEQHVYGSLEVILAAGKAVNMNKVLQNIDEAIEVQDFENEYQKLVHKDYWFQQENNKILENVDAVCQTKVKALKPKNVRDTNTVGKVNEWNRRNTQLELNTNDPSKTNKESSLYETVPLNKRYDRSSKPNSTTPSTSGTDKTLNTKTEAVGNVGPPGSPNKILVELSKPSKASLNNDRQPKLEMQKNRFKKVLMKESFSTRQPSRVLAHCRIGYTAEPVSTIAEVNFTDNVHTCLKSKGITDVFRIQAVAWPHLLRNHSLIVINAAETGKTWTYLPAVMSLAMEYENVPAGDGDGPVAIIVCLDWGAVKSVEKNCEGLMHGSGVRVEAFSLHDAENIQECKMLNGMDILITSIHCLLRLMESPLRLFNKKRLARIVFDEIDSMYQRFDRQKIQKIYNAFCTPDGQFIVTSKTWHRSLKKFCEKDDLLLCIGAYIEAAIYSNIDITVQSTSENDRFKQFLAYFRKKNYIDEQTVIVCDKPHEVRTIKNNFRSEGYAMLTYCDDKTDSEKIGSINQVISQNNTGALGVLICTDDTLADLNIRNAQHILHYSLPSNWTTFTQRFVASFDYYENIVGDGVSAGRPTSVVFVDAQSSDSMPRLVEFMKTRCFAKVSDDVLKFVEAKRIEREGKNTKYTVFCKRLTLFGVCDTQYTCKGRHILTKSDRATVPLPRNGKIKFEILSIHSPAHFTVRILQHRLFKQNEWQEIHVDDAFSFQIKLDKYFSDAKNCIPHHSPKLGDLCVIEDGDEGEMFKRCKIIGIDENTKEKMLLLMDSNVITKWLKCQDLFVLPDEFKDNLPLAVDIRIAGVVPLDLGEIWDTSKLTPIVRKWCDKKTENCHYEGTIEMSLMNCIWVKSIEMVEKLPSIHEELVKFNFKKEIVRRNLGLIHENSLELLRDMAVKAGILDTEPETPQTCSVLPLATESETARTCPVLPLAAEPEIPRITQVLPIANNQERGRGRGRFLNNSSSEIVRSPKLIQSPNVLAAPVILWETLTPGTFNEVDIGEFYTPDRIYVLLASEFTRFNQLRESISEFTNKSANVKPLINVEVGKLCLAWALNNNAYVRVQILNVYHESEVRIFWLDYGVQETFTPKDNDLIEIPENLITCLPFQAILCKMVGIRPLNDSNEWNENECDNIYQALNNSSIFVRCTENYSISDDIIKCNSYEAVFFDKKSERIINRLVVQNRFADYDRETEHVIDVDVDWNLLQLIDSTDEDVKERTEEDNLTCDLKYLLNLLENEDCDVQMDDLLEKLVEKEADKVVPTNPSPMPKAIVQNCDGGLTANRIKSTKKMPSQLSSPAKMPYIAWKQNGSTISINMSAPDVTDYSLRVGSRFVHFCFVLNNERYEDILNLFGCIDAKYTKHEVRGLNISIKLKKTLTAKHWPRLEKSPGRNQFIRCTDEYDDDSDENLETNASRLMPRDSDSDFSPSDEEDNVNIHEYENLV